MRRLRVITPEEQRILDGGAVDKAAYTARAVFTVDSEKLLERGRLISVRAHTRFAPFPRHAHSYIEIMYMCSGKTVHRINGGEPITVHAGELLFLELLNCTDKLAASENEGDHSALVMTALREIEENYRTASLTDIAEKYGVTISYLSAAVHSTTGFTFKSLLRRKRMEKAAALLSGTKLSVSDIIMAVGYENTSYFYRAFSEMYGVTPREYRLRQRG